MSKPTRAELHQVIDNPDAFTAPDHGELMSAEDEFALGYQAAVNRVAWPEFPSDDWQEGWERGRLWVAHQSAV